MSNFKLNLPTDIPWERICVTEDMIDPIVCDERLPAKWQSSMAVFKYKPEDDYQLFPNYKITYLKITATITGYQPMDKEIQGKIKWDGVDATTQFTNEVLKDLLSSYYPCNGAILQVVVGPHGKKPELPLKEYPFFMDFEPKKRELYELATDTSERSSRSIESLNITKSAGSTQSLEILDIDMGGGKFGMNGSYAGTGGGFSHQASNGQWGTKRINADESLAARSSDVGQEKRESFAFSTHISQMYNLLSSYHTGTNRVVFFIQPRPHTLEEPSGFVRGPRPVEGIQEFFMVVAQPKDQEDFCVSLRLDTSHLTTVPIMDYTYINDTTDIASITASIPTKNDTKAEIITRDACVNSVAAGAIAGAVIAGPIGAIVGSVVGGVNQVANGDVCNEVRYQCYINEKIANVLYQAPQGYMIEEYSDLINDVSSGSTDIVLAPNQTSLSINVKARGKNCFYESGICANCDDEINKRTGYSRRQLVVRLRSLERTTKIGDNEFVMITTRGLCCCSDKVEKINVDEYIVEFKAIPSQLSILNYLNAFQNNIKYFNQNSNDKNIQHSNRKCKECENETQNTFSPDKPDARYTIRLANELSNFIKTEAFKSLNDPTIELKKYYETDFFAKQLEKRLLPYNFGKQALYEGVEKDLPKDILPDLNKYFGKKLEEITHKDLLSLQGKSLAKLTGLKLEEVHFLKMRLMGIKFNPEEKNETPPKKKGDSAS